MRQKFFVAGVLLLLSFCFVISGFSRDAGDVAPNFTLDDLNGKTLSLESFKDKNNILMMFWTINGMYCAFELKNIAANYEDLKNNGFEVLAVNEKEDPKKIAEFVQKEGLNLPVLLDSKGEVAKLFEVRASPVMLIIDKKGVIKWRGYAFPLNYLKYVE